MHTHRFYSLFLILSLWFSTTGFQSSPLSRPAAAPLLQQEAAPLPRQGAAPLLAVTFSKKYPGIDAVDIPATSLTLEWYPVLGVTGVKYRYCLLPNQSKNPKAKCPTGRWVSTGTSTTVTVRNLNPGTLYNWWVRAYDSTNTLIATANSVSGSAGTWSFTTLNVPGAFNKGLPANNSLNQPIDNLSLTWGTSSSADSYEYCADTTNDSLCDVKWTNVGKVNTITLNGLANNAKYYWQVRAINLGGVTSANAGLWYNFSTATKTGLFTKLSPANGAANQPASGLMLSWMISQNATGYDYCLSETSSGCTTWIPVASNSVALGTLKFNKTYYWQARARSSGGTTEASGGLWTFTTQPDPPSTFDKVAPLDLAANVSNNPSLSWNPSSGVGVTYEYCLYAPVNNSPCGPTDWMPATGLLSSDVVGLDPAITYLWQVRAVNGTGATEANGGYWSFTTEAAPSPFSKAAPANGAANLDRAFTLSWNPAPGTNIVYQVCYDSTLDSTCDGDLWSAPQSATTFSLSGLDYATPYQWQVRAYNSAGAVYANDADTSLWWSFTTRLAPPADFGKIFPLDGLAGAPLNLHLDWGTSDPGVSYEYCLDTLNNDQCELPAQGGSGWVSSDSGATPTLAYATIYYWQVRAKKDAITMTSADGGQWWSFSTLGQPPSSFTKILPASGAEFTPRQPWLYWYFSPTAARYEYCVTTDIKTGCATWTSTGSSTYAHLSDPLSMGTKYYWQVRAVDAGGQSTDANLGEPEPWWSFTTQAIPPLSKGQSFAFNEDETPFTGQLLLTNTPSMPSSFLLVGDAPSGEFSLNADGSFRYTPAANFNGPVSFQFKVSDGYNLPSPVYTATLNIAPLNDPPTLSPLAPLTVFSDRTASFSAQGSDVDLPNDTLSYSVDNLPQGASIDPSTGLFTWKPLWWQRTPGQFTFNVIVTDKAGASATRPVTIQVISWPVYIPRIGR